MSNRFFEYLTLSGPIGTIDCAAQKPLTFAPGVFQLSLTGKVGPNESISLAKVQQKLAGAYHEHFAHLHIVLDSTGGDSDEGFRLYDHLRALPVPISVRVAGRCYSAALDILVAGSYRFASSESQFLAHPASRTRDELPDRLTTKVLAEASAALARVDAKVVDLLAIRTGTGREFFEKEIQSEEPMTAAAAYQCGLIHEIPDLTTKVEPRWPAVVRTQQFGKILIDRKLFAPSFLSACQTAGTLFDWDSVNCRSSVVE